MRSNPVFFFGIKFLIVIEFIGDFKFKNMRLHDSQWLFYNSIFKIISKKGVKL